MIGVYISMLRHLATLLCLAILDICDCYFLSHLLPTQPVMKMKYTLSFK